jgi:hypothetical protein
VPADLKSRAVGKSEIEHDQRRLQSSRQVYACASGGSFNDVLIQALERVADDSPNLGFVVDYQQCHGVLPVSDKRWRAGDVSTCLKGWSSLPALSGLVATLQ